MRASPLQFPNTHRLSPSPTPHQRKALATLTLTAFWKTPSRSFLKTSLGNQPRMVAAPPSPQRGSGHSCSSPHGHTLSPSNLPTPALPRRQQHPTGQVTCGSPASVAIPADREATGSHGVPFRSRRLLSLHPDQAGRGAGREGPRGGEESEAGTGPSAFPRVCAFNAPSPSPRPFVLSQLQLFLFAAAAVVLKGLFSHGTLSN